MLLVVQKYVIHVLLKWRYWSRTIECLRKNKRFQLVNRWTTSTYKQQRWLTADSKKLARQIAWNKRHSTDVNNYWHFTKRLIHDINRRVDLELNELILITLDGSESDQVLLTNIIGVLQPIISQRNRLICFHRPNFWRSPEMSRFSSSS